VYYCHRRRICVATCEGTLIERVCGTPGEARENRLTLVG
jgi:hypothetical protein